MSDSASQMPQNYLNQCFAAINSQIQLQLYATYIYLSMAYFCNQDEVALGFFALFFLRQSQKWMERTEVLFLLLTERHGSLTLGRIADQDRHDWMDGLMAMECAFHLEKTLNQSLLQLYQMASEQGDTYLCNLLKRRFLQQQVEVLKEMGGYVTNLRQMGAPENRLAEYLFDKLTLADSTKEN
ncbi:ferritin heavy chain-like [Cricetulus griseus]|uniref:Ferritin n=1 Tax=Cricetulus griseus TaxID=10029 RepID=G3I0U0_CRIGR|nr:ferritin heavy chain-like [Cricetulus griseus]XP_035316039.1 ferritin heavy chain-like [Cricetulus griseus]EGW01120.1 Ferritin heavy chain [Cricetulus griseus]ERE65049.1 ferritin heavy chain-like protein [Cricetulus griseus]